MGGIILSPEGTAAEDDGRAAEEGIWIQGADGEGGCGRIGHGKREADVETKFRRVAPLSFPFSEQGASASAAGNKTRGNAIGGFQRQRFPAEETDPAFPDCTEIIQIKKEGEDSAVFDGGGGGA